MGSQALDVAGTKARLEPASKYALTQFKSLGMSVTPKVPDRKKLEAAMGTKTPPSAVSFVLSFDGKTITYVAEVGGAKTVLATIPLSSTGKPGVQRAIIEKMVKLGGGSGAASKADLDKFNKDHPPPPTPEQQGKLTQALAPMRLQLRDANAEVKKAQAALDAAQAKVKALDIKMKPLLDVEKDYQKRWDAD